MESKKAEYGVRDIARECGVSPATVSRVFHQHPNVSETIREKVFQVAQKLSYRHTIKSGRNAIAIILPDFSLLQFGLYHTAIIPLLASEINRHGYGVILAPVNDIDMIKKYFIIGAVAVAFCNDIISRNWDNSFNIPLTVINSPSKRLDNAFSVASNEEQGMMLAVKHLVKNGHRKIGLIIDGTIDINASKRKRYVGFAKAIKAYNCVEDRGMIQMATTSNWMTEIGRIIRSGATAMICCGENSGFQIDYVMNLFGKKIPDEMSIITFEDPITSKYCTPPHTTIGQNFERIATEAILQLDSAIKKTTQPNDILIDYVLTERESVKKRPSGTFVVNV